MARPILSIVLPVYNEEEVIPMLHSRLQEFLTKLGLDTEVVFVNDGSKDNSMPLLRELAKSDPRYRVLGFSRNFGHQTAITAGLDYARGAAVVVMDADLQDPPEVVLEMVDQWRAGYDVVYGQRLSRVGESWFKLVTARWFYRFFRRMIPIEVPLDTGDFRLMSRQVVVALRSLREAHRFVRGMVAWLGFKQTAVLYDRPARAAGETKYPLRKMLRFAVDGITSFSVVPLRLATYFGVLTSAFSVLYAIWAVIDALVLHRTQPGWTSTVVLVSLLSGVQLLMIGILGEYVGRVYEQVKRRPLYLVGERVNLGDLDDDALDTVDVRANLPLPPRPEVAVALNSEVPQLAPPTPVPEPPAEPVPAVKPIMTRPKTLLGVAAGPGQRGKTAPMAMPPSPAPVPVAPGSPKPTAGPILTGSGTVPFPAVPGTATVVMPVPASKEGLELAKAAELSKVAQMAVSPPGVPVAPAVDVPPPPHFVTAPLKVLEKSPAPPPTHKSSKPPPPLPKRGEKTTQAPKK